MNTHPIPPNNAMNPRRIQVLDLARGSAIVFMVMVHILNIYALPHLHTTSFGTLIEFVGGPPAAPVFMFLMGISLVLSRTFQLKKGVIRGFRLLLAGYLLNLLRGTLPIYLGLKNGFITANEISPRTPLNAFWEVDILHFAGIAYILLSFLRHYHPRKPILCFALSAIVALFSSLLWGQMSGLPILDTLLMLMWGDSGELVAFPVFPWISYPLAGMGFGYLMTHQQHLSSLFLKWLCYGLGLFIIGLLIISTNPSFHEGDYWRSGPGMIIWITGFILIWLSILHFLEKKVPPNRLYRLLTYWSAHVTVFYFIHWLIITWGVAGLGFRKLDTLQTVGVMVLVLAITDRFTRLWVNCTKGGNWPFPSR